MAKTTHPRGKSIAKVGHLNVYQKNTNETKKGDNGVSVTSTTKTEIKIYNAKKEVEGNFKNKATAIARAKELLAEKK